MLQPRPGNPADSSAIWRETILRYANWRLSRQLLRDAFGAVGDYTEAARRREMRSR